MTLANREIRHSHGYSIPDFYMRSADNESCLQGVCMTSLTGTLEQIGMLAAFSQEIFGSLLAETQGTLNRIQQVGARIEGLGDKVAAYEAEIEATVKSDNPMKLYQHIGAPLTLDVPEDSQLFLPETLPFGLRARVEATQRPPNLQACDPLVDPNDGKDGVIQSCLQKYTDPGFFMRAWQESEEKKFLAAKDKKKQKRKDKTKKNKPQAADVQRVAKKEYDIDGAPVDVGSRPVSSNIKGRAPSFIKSASAQDNAPQSQPATQPSQVQPSGPQPPNNPIPPPPAAPSVVVPTPPPTPPQSASMVVPTPPPPPSSVPAPPSVVPAPPSMVPAPPSMVPAPPSMVPAPPSMVPAPPSMVPAAPSVVPQVPQAPTPPQAPAPPPTIKIPEPPAAPFAPPAPPAPPPVANAPPAPPPPPTLSVGSAAGGPVPISVALAGAPALKPTPIQVPKADGREGLMAAIRGTHSLRKVSHKPTANKQTDNVVANILKRRMAIESDSDGSGSESDSNSDWND